MDMIKNKNETINIIRNGVNHNGINAIFPYNSKNEKKIVAIVAI